ncbi:MAG TPA: ATP-binding protein [Polyangiaceae bacterium]|nr:ATP-binding protein [Polyangiaceae bacterium]
MPTAEDRLRALELELARMTEERDALRRANDTLQLKAEALDAAPLGAICVSGLSGRYEFINAEFARLIGRDQQTTLAADPFEIWQTVTHPEDLAAEQDAIARLARGEIDAFELDKRFVLPGGEARWVHVRAVCTRSEDQKLASMTVFFSDLQPQREIAAARDKLEQQLRRSQKLEALGKLAGGIAHDFNNRLVIIMGYAELMRRALDDDSPFIEHADIILASSQRAADLTRQLLAFSGRQVLKPEAFDLNVALEQMRRLLQGVVGDHIELQMSLQASQPISFDPGQLEQVVLNLAINARDAMPSGGRFELETRDVYLETDDAINLPAGEYVLLATRDSGSGIPDDVLPHIFEPFFTTKEIGKGTGLGLSMVQGIIHQSGGAVQVETRLDRGTTFKIYVPKARDIKPRPHYAVAQVPPPAAAFETVLVCDDDEGVRKLLLDILEFRAYKVLEATNGLHALELAREHDGPIHLLITDLVMAKLGGVELAAELRKTRPELAVLYISGYTEQPELLAVPLGPRTQFLAKPFLPGDLTSAVGSMLSGYPAEATVSAPLG